MRIEVGVEDDDPSLESERVREVLSAHLAGTGVAADVYRLPAGDLIDHVEWAEARAGPDVTAVYFVERLPDGRRRLYLTRGGGLWVRELPRADDEELLLESLGAMLRGTSVALGEEGAPRGMEAAERPAPAAPVEVERPATRQRPAVGIAVAYAGGNLDRAAPWQSGGAIALDVEFANAAWVGVGVDVFAPAKLRGQPPIDVWRIPVVVAGGFRFRKGKALRPGLGLGVVLEPFWWRPQAAPGAEAQPGQTVRVGLSPAVDLRWRVVRGFGFTVKVRADAWLLNADLAVEEAGVRRTRLAPHPAAAVLEAGLFYAF